MISKPFLTEALPDALDALKNFQTTILSTRNLNFWYTSIGSDFSKSETVVGHILQSVIAFNQKIFFQKILIFALSTLRSVKNTFWPNQVPSAKRFWKSQSVLTFTAQEQFFKTIKNTYFFTDFLQFSSEGAECKKQAFLPLNLLLCHKSH